MLQTLNSSTSLISISKSSGIAFKSPENVSDESMIINFIYTTTNPTTKVLLNKIFRIKFFVWSDHSYCHLASNLITTSYYRKQTSLSDYHCTYLRRMGKLNKYLHVKLFVQPNEKSLCKSIITWLVAKRLETLF